MTMIPCNHVGPNCKISIFLETGRRKEFTILGWIQKNAYIFREEIEFSFSGSSLSKKEAFWRANFESVPFSTFAQHIHDANLRQSESVCLEEGRHKIKTKWMGVDFFLKQHSDLLLFLIFFLPSQIPRRSVTERSHLFHAKHRSG
jgi:hypothetical protein